VAIGLLSSQKWLNTYEHRSKCIHTTFLALERQLWGERAKPYREERD
jgi:hypothetical protein